jgi:two-component system response regulator HydG
MTNRVLVVDDEPEMCQLISDDLGRRGLDVLTFTSPDAALEALRIEEVGAVVADVRMPGMDGLELCRRVHENDSELPVVVMTAFGSLETAVEAIRAGAFDFVTKPVEMDLLAIAVERALKHRRLAERVRILSEEVERSQHLGDLLGESEPMLYLFDQVKRIADSEATILITGESGTGKELVARALHRGSRRRRGTLVSINCAALPENLLESELFGHERGAFTGAHSARKGLFTRADGGTLYLDEISELPLSLQPKLLRALEEGQVRPVGSEREIPFDARLVAATNRSLDEMVEKKRFRRDLYYRVNVIEIAVPPLRDRGNDILLLAQHFVSQFAERNAKGAIRLSEPVAQKLLAYEWPGNVRELKNAMERAVALTRSERLSVDDLPERVRQHEPTRVIMAGSEPAELQPLETVERRYILHVLKVMGGNKTSTARVLGCDRKTLHRKLKAYGLDSD